VVKANPIVSDTGELAWYLSPNMKGLVTLESARSHALIGYINEDHKNLKNLRAAVSNQFCSIVLTSVDSRPISKSTRMLLTAGARVVNTDLKWNENRTALAAWGGSPTMIEPVMGRVVLRNLEKAVEVRVRVLDGAGSPIDKPILAKRTQDGWEIEIGEPASTWYEVTVRR
jgi:hypothetical protein